MLGNYPIVGKVLLSYLFKEAIFNDVEYISHLDNTVVAG